MLSELQVAFFRENGYLHIRNGIGSAELQGIREAADWLITHADEVSSEHKEDYKYGALVGDGIGQGDRLCRLEYTLNKDTRFLMLLANPQVLSVAASLHGSPIVITWEDMIIKTPHAGFGVPFHQDLLYQSVKTPVFSVGVYLDDSAEDPLYVLPGTQRLGPLSNAEIKALVAERENELVAMPVRAGDLLVHNVLMIHGSHPNVSKSPRRVIYLEFRTLPQVLDDSPWSHEWLQKRLQLIPAALRLRQQSHLRAEDDPELLRELDNHVNDWLPPLDSVQAEPQLRIHHDPRVPV